MVEPVYSNFSALNGVDFPYNETTMKQFQDDVTWIISCSFTIFTKISGRPHFLK